MLQARPITAGDPAYPLVKELYHEAFPFKERFSLLALRLGAMKPEMEFLAYFDAERDNAFAGMSYTIEAGEYLYILYLAVPAESRGQGYGTQILDLLHEMYPDHSLVLEIEPLDKKADNYDQRVARLAFYERNGFHLVGYELFDGAVRYSMLATGDDFDVDAFSRSVRQLSHGLWRFKILPAT